MVLALAQPGAGPNATAITTANCTSGDQWDLVSKGGTGTTSTFDNTASRQIHGNTTSSKLLLANVASTDYFEWKAKITSTNASSYLRFYIYMTANPANISRLCNFNRGANLMQSGLNITTAGKLATVNAVGTTLLTSTASVALNAWNRIEFETVGFSGTTSTIIARFFSGANLEGTTPDETLSSAGATTSAIANAVRFGAATTSTANTSWWLQDMAFNDTAQPGSIVAVTALPRPAITRLFAVQRAASY